MLTADGASFHVPPQPGLLREFLTSQKRASRRAAQKWASGGWERCTFCFVRNPDVSDRVIKQRLAILGKLAKVDPSGRSTGKLRWTSPRRNCAQQRRKRWREAG